MRRNGRENTVHSAFLKRIARRPCHACSHHVDTVPETDAAQRFTRGFTLAETMLALAIVTVLAGMVTMGIPAAFSAYSNVVKTSNAQVVLTSATTAFRNELGLASATWTADAKDDNGAEEVIGFVSAEGSLAKISKGPNESGQQESVIKISYYAGSTESSTFSPGSPIATKDLVPEAMVNNSSQGRHELKLTYEAIKYKPGVFVIEGLKVKDLEDNVLASVDTYEVKAIMLEGVD